MGKANIDKGLLDWLCNEILSLIEIGEARLLNWGFIDIRTNLSEELPILLTRLTPNAAEVWKWAQQSNVTPNDLLENLVQRKLVFLIDGYYRSRFAEVVRLLYLLRQRFSFDDWQTANKLVSDIRIQLQRRSYPRRDVCSEEVIKALKDNGAPENYLAVISQLLKNTDGNLLTLARFQHEAILQQFLQLRSGGDRALVIGAGTGAGKTKAFYIPAMAEIVGMISTIPSVKILAIYPRTELLKDQLAEAFTETRKLDLLLKTKEKPPISMGAYYGDTLPSAKFLLNSTSVTSGSSWSLRDDGTGWICPYFFCPNPACNNREMIWSKDDVNKEAKANEHGQYGQYARLKCPSCHYEITSAHLVLTREQMIHHPPDILFTTTEMLNRRLARSSEHELFGINTSNPPRLVLLDEIHTYEGLHGAQVAYLLRRWHYARGSSHSSPNVCFVGLSATLREAESFFSRLTGIPQHQVTYIAPSDKDLLEEAMEYNLVLKGDPVSGTSLLSTSVQSVMLLSRFLDRARPTSVETVSRGVIGEKIFAFSDKLDVINRWYHIETDAEMNKTLSKYRKAKNDTGNDVKSRMSKAGQIWPACEMIGHNLYTPLRLGLTSSQYRGVKSNADVIIATSTLEVGFNDVTVGAVVQHKAPRSLASFLQRKGRAGRTRIMRPWMLVVASAYGRDRWAFQHSENLFNPLLPPLELPIQNYYIQKIQATYALLDWLTHEMKKQGITIDAWEICTNKGITSSSSRRFYAQKVCALLKKIIDGDYLGVFTRYLQLSLALDDQASVDSILWGEPRPLLTEVIPTLLRQLESDWQIIKDGNVIQFTDDKSSTPLPRFLPSSLFSDLNLPELIIHIPENAPRKSSHRKQTDESVALSQPVVRDVSMDLTQALQEFAPGNVSKRFSRKEYIKESHWLSLPDEAQLSRGMLPLQYLKVIFNPVPELIAHGDRVFQVYKPVEYSLDLVPSNIKDTSSARLLWKSNFIPVNQMEDGLGREKPVDPTSKDSNWAANLSLTPGSHWIRLIKQIQSNIQVHGAYVKITRFAVGVEIDTRYEHGNQVRRRLSFEENGEPAGIGFTLDSDAIKFDLEPLDLDSLVILPQWPRILKTLVANYFLYRLRSDLRIIEAGLSNFEIEWLWQLELSMLTAVAIAKNVSLQEAALDVGQNRVQFADRTMRVIFQSQQQSETGDDDMEGRLFKRLMEYQSSPTIVDALCDCETVLWSQQDKVFYDWLRECYASSLGALIYSAITQLIPDIQAEDLAMDLIGDTVWISETTAGGIGLISKVADAISQYPRNFELQLDDCLQYCEREHLAGQLELISEKIEQDQAIIRHAFNEVRKSIDLPKIESSRLLLTQALKTYGIPISREIIVALNTKFLRPNSDRDSDELIAMLVSEWKKQEVRLGITIDLRVMAVAAWRIPAIQNQIKSLITRTGGGFHELEENQVFNLIQSLLWLKCTDSCPDCIEYWSPYQELPHPSRYLVSQLINIDVPAIAFQEEAWVEKIRESLTLRYQALVLCEQGQLSDCKQCLLNMMIDPIEIGFQALYPTIEGIYQKDKTWQISIVVKELLGG
jgi:hypothetical protein